MSSTHCSVSLSRPRRLRSSSSNFLSSASMSTTGRSLLRRSGRRAFMRGHVVHRRFRSSVRAVDWHGWSCDQRARARAGERRARPRFSFRAARGPSGGRGLGRRGGDFVRGDAARAARRSARSTAGSFWLRAASCFVPELEELEALVVERAEELALALASRPAGAPRGA